MLPDSIYSEIFDVRYKIGDMAKEFISDKFASHSIHISEVQDNDLAVTFYSKSEELEVELRIDRVEKSFTISAISNGWTIFPVSGDWAIVTSYLEKLSNSIPSLSST